jgi:excisionase family DNA binding protein
MTDAEIRELDAVLRTPVVAELLDSSTDTIYAMVARGELPALRLGRSLRFSKAAILAWIDGPPPGDAA